jgi:hypothetical protein
MFSVVVRSHEWQQSVLRETESVEAYDVHHEYTEEASTADK